jgi:predicted ArsR family transcriptional regulator
VENPEPALTPAQQRVLGVLAAAGRPLSLAEVEESTGLHRNTVRGHLDALVAAERVTRVRRHTGARGRPAWAYWARVPEYAALAQTLAEALENPGGERPGEAAVRSGRSWGRRVRTQLEEDDRDTDAAARDRARLLLALEHTGFAPEADGDRIRLTRCPLLDAARSHGEVVCGAHLGLIEGVLGRAGSADLEPFAERDACLVHLRA